MRLVTFISFAVVFVTSNVDELQVPSHHLIEKSNADRIQGIQRISRARAEHYHEVIFAVKHRNLDWLESKLNEVSYPDSPDYGKHLSKDEIAAVVTSPESTETVRQYLEAQGFTIQRETRYGEFIFVDAPIHQFEKLFATEFHEYTMYNHQTRRDELIIRAEHYSLPQELVEHLEAAFSTVQFPPPSIFHGHYKTSEPATSLRKEKEEAEQQDISSSASYTGYVYPALLNDYYCIPSNVGNNLTSQAVYESLNQTLSPSDLSTFQTYFGLPQEKIAGDYNGHVNDQTCLTSPDDCAEANLDVQYLMGIAQKVPTFYSYWNSTGNTDIFVNWITAVANLADPQDVYSISYSGYEFSYSISELDAWNIQAQILGLRGTTIIASVKINSLVIVFFFNGLTIFFLFL
jgi:hypothetical protein